MVNELPSKLSPTTSPKVDQVARSPVAAFENGCTCTIPSSWVWMPVVSGPTSVSDGRKASQT